MALAEIHFEIIGKPYGKGRPRFTKSGHTYTPKETTSYENLVKLSYQQQCNGKRLDGAIIANIVAVYPIPKSASKKKRAEMIDGKILPQVKPDCDNVAKTVLDALNKIAYDDDSQVAMLIVTKMYGEVPRVVVDLDNLEKLEATT